MKKLYFLIPLIILLYLLPGQRKELVDLTGNPVLEGLSIQWPATRIVFEPLNAAAEYVLSFDRYVVQMLSWLFWIGLSAGAIAAFRRKQIGAIVRRICLSWLCVLSFFLIVVAFPFSAPKLRVPEGSTVIDLHSHTWYSHDGGAAPKQSMFFHRRLGFDTFFVTEHNHTSSFEKFPAAVRLQSVFPGVQMSTNERISLLILANRPFEGAEFEDCTVRELIDKAHARGFVVICPHWWKWRHFTWDELYALGIDGFEISNAGYRKFTAAERAELVRFCTEKNLLMIGTTDWHGWGYSADVWTVLPVPPGNTESLFAHLRAHGQAQVLTLSRPELRNMARYVFEPFIGAYYYGAGMSAWQAASWAAWIILFVLLGALQPVKRFLRSVPLLIGLLFFAMSVYAIIVWIPLLPENMVLGRLMAPILAGMSFLWLLYWRTVKS